MPEAYQVTCHTPDDQDADRRIQGLGGPGGGGWWHDLDYLIQGIENQTYRLWITDQRGDSVWVIVAERRGRKYLKTTSDGIEPNNLLALQRCS